MLLEKARKELPDVILNRERFELPNVRGHIQGSRTVISNFQQIAAAIRRPPEHLLKYVLRELATPGEIKKGLAIFGAKIPASRINQKIRKYTNELVLCTTCGKPDTDMTKEAGMTYIKCNACGAKYPVKTKI